VSHDRSEIIIICRFDAQGISLNIIINVGKSFLFCFVLFFMETAILFFQDSMMKANI